MPVIGPALVTDFRGENACSRRDGNEYIWCGEESNQYDVSLDWQGFFFFKGGYQQLVCEQYPKIGRTLWCVDLSERNYVKRISCPSDVQGLSTGVVWTGTPIVDSAEIAPCSKHHPVQNTVKNNAAASSTRHFH